MFVTQGRPGAVPAGGTPGASTKITLLLLGEFCSPHPSGCRGRRNAVAAHRGGSLAAYRGGNRAGPVPREPVPVT
ncbi:hypothetical protein FRAHR75_500004 [Frankia sp. Hr75.2]|nr:hypothetical protein FRAHR75_500004 [Frankia sp. Hr75.2]